MSTVAPTFYVRTNGSEYGPYSAAQLQAMVKQGQLKPEDGIRREQSGNWHKAASYKELFSNTAQPSGAKPAPVSEQNPFAESNPFEETNPFVQNSSDRFSRANNNPAPPVSPPPPREHGSILSTFLSIIFIMLLLILGCGVGIYILKPDYIPGLISSVFNQGETENASFGGFGNGAVLAAKGEKVSDDNTVEQPSPKADALNKVEDFLNSPPEKEPEKPVQKPVPPIPPSPPPVLKPESPYVKPEIENLSEWVKENNNWAYGNADSILKYGTKHLREKLSSAKSAERQAKADGFADEIAAAKKKLKEVNAEIIAEQNRIAKKKFWTNLDFNVDVEHDDGQKAAAAIKFAFYSLRIYNDSELQKAAANSTLWKFCFPVDKYDVNLNYSAIKCTVTGSTENIKELKRGNYALRIYFTDYRCRDNQNQCQVVRFEIRRKDNDDDWKPLLPIDWGRSPETGGRVSPGIVPPVVNRDLNEEQKKELAQIAEITRAFSAMSPPQNVDMVLSAFRDEIIPQIRRHHESGKVEKIIPVQSHGFDYENEKFNIALFLQSPQVEQFDMLCNAACGSGNIKNPQKGLQTRIVIDLKQFRSKIK